MNEGVLAEDVLDRPAQRLAAVDHEQDRLLGVEAAVDQVGQQRPGERGVLGRSLPQPERDLHALGGDPQRDDVRAIGDLHAVEHHHRQAHVLQPTAHQLRSAVRVRSMNMSETAVLRGRGGLLLDLCTDRLADTGEAAGGDAGEHPVHHRPRQRVAVGEVLIRRDGQLVLVVGRAHPRSWTATRRPPSVIDPSSWP